LEVSAEDCIGRQDLRELPFVTIDGADARDFDDAVYCRATRDGYKLFVAIADVAHYVREGTALDAAARERGTTVYFPDRVFPMLPEALSNGICSLRPTVDRLVLVCELALTAEGEPKKARFYNGVIHSHARLIYEEVAGWLGAARTREATVRNQVLLLHELYLKLRTRREVRLRVVRVGTGVDPLDAALHAPDAGNTGWRIAGDPTEAALLTLAAKAGIDVAALRTQAPRVAELHHPHFVLRLQERCVFP
jgi:VacB/RNase II family 3'-5' exoribonuclease